MSGVRLISRDGTKFWTAALDGLTLTTRTGKIGAKGRASTKTLADRVKARAALDKAVRAKAHAGFAPVEPSVIPAPFVEAPEPDSKLQVRPVPHKGEQLDCAPLSYGGLSSEYGSSFEDAPAGRNLWFPEQADGTLEVLVGWGREVQSVTPRLFGHGGDFYKSFPLWFTGHAFADERRMALAVDATLYALDVVGRTATTLWSFADVDELKEHLPVVWQHDGEALLGLHGDAVCRIDAGGVHTVLTLEGRPPTHLVRLADGLHAVLQPERVTVFAVEGDTPRVTHTIDCRKATGLGTWLDGSVLIVLGRQDRETGLVGYAVHEQQLHPFHRSAKMHAGAYQRRGLSWLEYDQGAPSRVFNVAAVYQAALEHQPIGAHHVIAQRSAIDAITDALTNNSGVSCDEAIEVARENPEQQSEAFGVTLTPLAYALLRAGKGDARAKRIARGLVAAGADVNVPTSDGRTPLGLAYEGGLLGVASDLIKAGALAEPPAEVERNGGTIAVVSPLLAAATRGYVDEVERLLDGGANLDRENERGETATSCALARGNHELALSLLERGARCNEKTLEAATLGRPSAKVLAIVGERCLDAVRSELGTRLLRNVALSASCYPECRDAPGVLSSLGARNTNPDCMSYLIDAGLADVVATQLTAGADPNGAYPVATGPSHPLHRAVSREPADLDVVGVLLDAGADVTLPATSGRLPLTLAVAAGPEFVSLLVERGAPLGRGDQPWSPTHAAAAQGRVEVLEVLARAGADLQEHSVDGHTPLGLAAGQRQLAAVRWLLGRSVEVDGGRLTPLMSAALGGSVEVIDALLDAGASVSLRGRLNGDEPERTAYEHAVAAGNRSAAKRLAEPERPPCLQEALDANEISALERSLSEGADANEALDATGRRPLHRALSAEAVAMLVSYGAKVDGADKHGNTPLQFASARSDGLAVVRALLEAGAKPNGGRLAWRAARRAAGAGNLETLAALHEAGAGLDARGATSPLHAAAKEGRLSCVQWLLEHGAKVVAFDEGAISGRKSPLHLAAAAGHVEVVEALLAAGARPDDRAREPDDLDFGGRTPLHDAAEGGHVDTLVALLRADDCGGRYAETNNGRSVDSEASEHPAAYALLEAVIGRGLDLEEVLAAQGVAGERTPSPDDAGLRVQRLNEPPYSSERPAPAAVERVIEDHEDICVSPDGLRCVVFRESRGTLRPLCGDEDGIHELADAPRVNGRGGAHDAGKHFVVAADRKVYEIDVPSRSLRLVVEAQDDVEALGYAGDLIVVQCADRLTAYGRQGTLAWSVDAAGIFDWYATGGPVVVVKPRAYVLGVVLCHADEDGLRTIGWHDEKVDEVFTVKDQAQTRIFFLGLVGENWDIERYQELLNPEAAVALPEILSAPPNDKKAFSALPQIAYR